jgi:probable phosphoglycerate mutase
VRIYIVRHGQTETNKNFVPGTKRPKTEPLNQAGLKQAEQAADFITYRRTLPSLIISSPYVRALQTAKVIQTKLGLPLQEDDDLGEYNPGDWDGKHMDELAELFSKINVKVRHRFRPPNGESWFDEAQRFCGVIERAEQDGYTCIVLVSHYDPIKAAINSLTRKPIEHWGNSAEYPPGSVTVLDKSIVGWRLSELQFQ